MPQIDLVDMRETPPEPGPVAVPALGEGGRRNARSGRTGLAVPQSARLCAGGPMQGVRRAYESARQRFLAGRAPIQRAPGLPPHRLFDAPPRDDVLTAGPRTLSCRSVQAWSGWKRKQG